MNSLSCFGVLYEGFYHCASILGVWNSDLHIVGHKLGNMYILGTIGLGPIGDYAEIFGVAAFFVWSTGVRRLLYSGQLGAIGFDRLDRKEMVQLELGPRKTA